MATVIGMQVINREETESKYPNIHKRGVIAIITATIRGRTYQINESVNGKLSKPLLVPAWIAA